MDTDNDKYWRDQLVEVELREAFWKELATRFVNACEIDGFGGVRDAHMGELSQAYRDFQEAVNG